MSYTKILDNKYDLIVICIESNKVTGIHLFSYSRAGGCRCNVNFLTQNYRICIYIYIHILTLLTRLRFIGTPGNAFRSFLPLINFSLLHTRTRAVTCDDIQIRTYLISFSLLFQHCPKNP